MTEPRKYQSLHLGALYVLAAGVCLGEGVGLGGLGLLLVTCILRRKELPWRDLASGPSLYWLGGWAAWLIAGLVMLAGSGEGALKPSEGFRHITILATPLVFISLRSLPSDAAKKTASVVAAMLCLSALFGIYQWLTSSHPLTFLVRADSSIATQAMIPGQGDAMAATGFFFHRLKMAHVLVLGIGVTGYFWLRSQASRRLLTPLAAVFVVCLAGTYAKAAMGAVAGASLFVLGIVFLRKAMLISAIIAAGSAAMLLFGNPEISQLIHDSMGIRKMIWSQAAQIIHDYPAGAGLGNYPSVVGHYYDYSNPAFHIRTYPHHLLLSWWAESGLVGMLCLGAGWIATAVIAIRRMTSQAASKEQKYLSACLVFSLVSFWIIGLTHDVLYHPSVALMFFSVVGWLMGQCRDDELREIE